MEGSVVGAISPEAIFSLVNANMNGDEYVSCMKCGFAGCDIRLSGCGCTLHARCCPVKKQEPIQTCPHCLRPSTGFVLLPMSFREIDESRRMATAIANNKRDRGRKRKSHQISPEDENANEKKKTNPEEKNVEPSDRRTGRWTQEETAFCDKMIALFKGGQFPVARGVKLNDFLANMLKSKQSRLTKKMKNAKLSSVTFSTQEGHIFDPQEARSFSELEDQFFNSIQDHLERAEIKFHMQKEWRELFSSFCASMGQPLDENSFLSSVEEMERRATLARDAARMTRRKIMTSHALNQDVPNVGSGVYIESTEAELKTAQNYEPLLLNHGSGSDNEDLLYDDVGCEYPDSLGGMYPEQLTAELSGKTNMLHASPFIGRIMDYVKRHKVPFEHVDVWVPSFVPDENPNSASDSKCRLCFSGSATSDTEIVKDNTMDVTQEIPRDAKFHLNSFGEYSQKFSFDVGSGLPGRVYQSGVPAWEQGVDVAPNSHFERVGAAQQWGIKTVVGIPITSPSVGRVVVLFYSRHYRSKDHEMVSRISKELNRLMPSPKWKLVVDISFAPTPVEPHMDTSSSDSYDVKGDEDVKDETINEIITMLGQHMPSSPNSSLAPHCQAFISLRLLLLRPTRSQADEDTVRIITGSYRSYKSSGRSPSDICVMLACDFQFLQQAHQNHSSSAVQPSYIKSNSAKNMPQYVFTQKNLSPQTDHFSQLGNNSPTLTATHPPQHHHAMLDNVSIISA